jgi:Ca2+-binding RTX toxin-like protein
LKGRFLIAGRGSRASALAGALALPMMAAIVIYGMGQAEGAAPSCFGRNATITSNAEFVPGTDGPDVIVTGNADNSVVAGGGGDRVCLGDGKDFARGDTGYDVCDGGLGQDTVRGCEA